MLNLPVDDQGRPCFARFTAWTCLASPNAHDDLEIVGASASWAVWFPPGLDANAALHAARRGMENGAEFIEQAPDGQPLALWTLRPFRSRADGVIEVSASVVVSGAAQAAKAPQEIERRRVDAERALGIRFLPCSTRGAGWDSRALRSAIESFGRAQEESAQIGLGIGLAERSLAALSARRL